MAPKRTFKGKKKNKEASAASDTNTPSPRHDSDIRAIAESNACLVCDKGAPWAKGEGSWAKAEKKMLLQRQIMEAMFLGDWKASQFDHVCAQIYPNSDKERDEMLNELRDSFVNSLNGPFKLSSPNRWNHHETGIKHVLTQTMCGGCSYTREYSWKVPFVPDAAESTASSSAGSSSSSCSSSSTPSSSCSSSSASCSSSGQSAENL